MVGLFSNFDSNFEIQKFQTLLNKVQTSPTNPTRTVANGYPSSIVEWRRSVTLCDRKEAKRSDAASLCFDGRALSSNLDKLA